MSTPYREKWTSECGTVTLYCGDCLEILPTLAPGSVDAVVTSPPYNQRLDQFRASGFKAEGASQWADRISAAYFDSMPEDEYQDKQRAMLDSAYAAASDHASLFYNHKCRWRDKQILHPLDIVRGTKWTLRQELIWFRDGSLTQNAKMFPPCDERILWMYKRSWLWNDESNRFLSVWRINSEKRSEHAVAYPVELPSRAVEATTTTDSVVLDPYMGSGTTGVACVRLGRRFIGIELEPKYYAIAKRRIQDELNRVKFLEPKQRETQRTLLEVSQ